MKSAVGHTHVDIGPSVDPIVLLHCGLRSRLCLPPLAPWCGLIPTEPECRPHHASRCWSHSWVLSQCALRSGSHSCLKPCLPLRGQAPCASGAHLSRWSRHALRYSPHSILPVLPLPPSFHGVLCVLGPCLHLVTRRARAWHGQGTVCYAACMPVGCAVRSCLVYWGGCVYYAHMPVGCAASTVHTLITFSALMWPGKL